MKGKIVIALICHFSNEEIQAIIKPWKKIPEFAPWIPSLASIFENTENIELHLISPHKYIFRNKTFQQTGIYYHFFNAQIPIWGHQWPGFFKLDFLTNFYFNKKVVWNIVNRINPDVIHLFGSENAYYSSTILQFIKKYPVVITIQGFISKSYEIKKGHIRKRIKIEKEIIKTFTYYIANTETVGKDIVTINPDATICQIHLPIKIPQSITIKKEFDLVFFARVTKDKGIEDLLQAVSIIRQGKPNISLCVIGGGKLDAWKEKAEEFGISDNVYWAGFLPTQNDVHKMASSARISVLPTYHDIISGTIVESLFLKLPVVAYNVGSIHEVNRYEKIISLVEKFDISGLAKSILILLNDPQLQENIAEKGYTRAHEMFNVGNDKIKAELLNAYSEAIKDFTARSK